jgi:cell division protein FtsN
MRKTYEFAFERSQLIQFVGGLTSLVVLVFVAGFLIGVGLPLNEAPAVLVVQAPQPPYRPELPLTAGEIPAGPVQEQVAAIAVEDLPAVEGDPYEPVFADQDAEAVAANEEPAEPIISGKFAVQLGAFLSKRNAESLTRKLSTAGYDVSVVVREDSHGRNWYLVRFGLFPSRAEATAVAVDLKARENFEALVRPSGSM